MILMSVSTSMNMALTWIGEPKFAQTYVNHSYIISLIINNIKTITTLSPNPILCEPSCVPSSQLSDTIDHSTW